jgi:hypothetical protein
MHKEPVMNWKSKKSWILAGLAFVAPAFADVGFTESDEQNSLKENVQSDLSVEAAPTIEAEQTSSVVQSDQPTKVKKTKGKKQQKMMPGFTAATRPMLRRCVDVFAEGSMLWWQASEDGLAFAQEGNLFAVTGIRPIGEITPSVLQLKIYEPKFKWDFGFQVGAGYNMRYDGWDLYSSWVRFHPKRSHRTVSIPLNANTDTNIEPGVPTLIPMFDYFDYFTNQSSIPGSSVSSSWKLKLDLVDLELGRESKFGKRLRLRPHGGLRSAWIDQTYTITSLGFSPFVANVTQNVVSSNKCYFWGLGPRIGLDMQWNFGYGISLFSDLALSSLFGHFSLTTSEVLTSPESRGTFSINESSYKRRNVARFAGDFDIGLRYQTTFNCCDCLGLMLQAGWEAHNFLNQNQFIQGQLSTNIADNNEISSNTVFNQGDLTTQGLTVRARLDF